MGRMKIEALRIQHGCKTQQIWIDEINKYIPKKLSVRTYRNRLMKRSKWTIDELDAISRISNIPIEDIDY